MKSLKKTGLKKVSHVSPKPVVKAAPVSLAPLKTDQAMAGLLAVKPHPKGKPK